MVRRLLAIAVVLSACAAAGVADPTSVPGPGTSGVAPTSTTQATTSTLPEPNPDLAPDFTLQLSDGQEFTLSETTRPVYLLFWAEWCPVCRRELPVVDGISSDYADRVDFIAPVWKSAEEATREAAARILPSGNVKWGLDLDRIVFGLYGVPYQPVTVLISSHGLVVEEWAGVRSEQRIRESLDALIAASAAPGS
jgi:hypothetical protein